MLMAPDDTAQRKLIQLLDYPREELGTEIKDWLDLAERSVRADLARELLALANHGGGYVLFGFIDQTTGWIPSGPCPYDLTKYSQDEINNILKKHAEPTFECGVHHLNSSSGTQHVIIEVPGGHRVPIRSKGGPPGSRLVDHTYYIRRPGPESAPPQDGREWGELISKCVENDRERLIESFRRVTSILGPTDTAAHLLNQAVPSVERLRDWQNESVARPRAIDAQLAEEYESGFWSCAYVVGPVDPAPSLAGFRTLLTEVKGSETGWPPWLSLDNRPGMEAHVVGDLIECWLRETPDGDFWRANPSGEMFLMRRLQEDVDFPSQPTGSFLDVTLPVWRVGECLLHATRLAQRLEASTISVIFSWKGLEGRELRALASPTRSLMPGKICHEDEVNTSTTRSVTEVVETLPEIVQHLLTPLYARFDFFDPPTGFYAGELSRMRTGT
jgi:hypothetical protein